MLLKLSLWLGAPPIVTFLFSSSAVRVQNALFIFALLVVALLFGIGPRSHRKDAR
ncbi:MAG: hypothetical protein ACJ8J7_17765 [Sulfurifustaceae bacterium]